MVHRIPITALLIGLVALMMLVPAVQAAVVAEWRIARGFLYPSITGLFAAAAIGVLLRPMEKGETAEHELLTLLILWTILPVYACLPLILLTPAIGWSGAWFEMVASLTTTGGSVYSRTDAAPGTIHLWRGMMGWLGGLLTLLAAYIVLAPRRLGGFEVMAAADGLVSARSVDLRVRGAEFESRTRRAMRIILPPYLLMTLILALIFNTTDKAGLISAVHAMSVVSTSGISPVQGGFAASGSFLAELAAAAFMVLAASRLLYAEAAQTGRRVAWRDDPELRMLAFLVLSASAMLFARHWVGVLTIDVEARGQAVDAFEAAWGALFTTLSFATTTGFESFAWESARNWSGLENPGLMLLALCLIGGGAATTAGGLKLIRAYALMRHGIRELERIAMPHSVAGSGRAASRGLRREGAFIAWAFMMLFLLALLLAVLGLTLTEMSFPAAFTAAVAALSNTGPVFKTVAGGQGFAGLDWIQHVILAVVMILGRVETLAVIALFNPDGWSRLRTRKKRTGKTDGETPLSDW